MSFVTVEKEGATGVVTLARPPVNALDEQFLDEIYEAVQKMASDDGVRAVLFRSGISGIFVAGADLKAFQDEETTRKAITAFRRCFDAIDALPKPTIAAIGGHALGGGCELTLACDFRLMIDDERSTIGLPEVSLGLFPGAGGTQRLPRIVGQARALDIVMHGRRLKGREAEAIGLVHELLPEETFDEKARAYASKLAAGPTKALAAAKRFVRSAFDTPLREGLQGEAEAFVQIRNTEDAKTGVQAFLAKETPKFIGQ